MEEFIEAVAKAQAEANAICKGVTIRTKQEPYGLMVYLSYGDVRDCFNATGYNYLYNMKRLYNNEVMKAILE